MVHAALQGSVQMREGLCARAESHILAKVISRSLSGCSTIGVFYAEPTLLAGDADFEGDALANSETGRDGVGAESGDDARSFVTQDEW